jgi:ethanolamine permease
MGKNNQLTTIFAGIGLFGLIASFHGLIIGYSRQIFALSRSGFLPKIFSNVNARFRTPHWALILGGAIGLISLFTGTTLIVITISALGAVVMYSISMISLLKLKKDNSFQSSFKTPLYPWFPIIALMLSLVCIGAIVYYNVMLSIIFFAGLLVAFLLLKLSGTKNISLDNDVDKNHA